MASVNKVILIGSLGKDPEIKYLPSGDAVDTLNVATTEKFKKNDGWQEETEWSRVVIFGKQADTAGKYLIKGSQVYIEGRLQTKKWTDKQNIERYTTQIIASTFKMLGGKPAESREEKPASRPQQKQQAQQSSPHGDDWEDDIPF